MLCHQGSVIELRRCLTSSPVQRRPLFCFDDEQTDGAIESGIVFFPLEINEGRQYEEGEK